MTPRPTRPISDLDIDEYECFRRTGRFARFAFRKSLTVIEWREHDRFAVAHDKKPLGVVELKAIQRLQIAKNRIETLLHFEKFTEEAARPTPIAVGSRKPAKKKKAA